MFWENKIIAVIVTIVGGLVVAAILGLPRKLKGRNQRPKLKPKELYENLKGIVGEPNMTYVYLPSLDRQVYGRGWNGGEWVEILPEWAEDINDNDITVADFGQKYYLIDLMSGKVLSIPVDPQKGLTLQDSGIKLGQKLMLRKTKTR